MLKTKLNYQKESCATQGIWLCWVTTRIAGWIPDRMGVQLLGFARAFERLDHTFV
jgi:hypothetical protein